MANNYDKGENNSFNINELTQKINKHIASLDEACDWNAISILAIFIFLLVTYCL